LGALLVFVSALGRPMLLSAANWVPEGNPTIEPRLDVSCVSPSFCKAVGTIGAIESFNGTGWSTDISPTTQQLSGVSCVSSSFCKAVGDNGTILSWNGAGWTTDTSGTTLLLLSVACVSSNFCKAVGERGTVLSWNGTGWSVDTSPTMQILFEVSCVSSGFCKAVGDNGTILSFNGTGWSADTSGSTQFLAGVSCVSSSFCKAVGRLGTILSFNGTGWSPETGGTTAEIRGVSCVSSSFCKAVDGIGTILSFNGTGWSLDSSPTMSILYSVSCVSTSFCKAVSGIILSLQPGSVDLAVSKMDSPDPVVAGTNLTYTVTVTNNGGGEALNVRLSDQVPPGTTFMSFSAPSGWTPTTPAIGGSGTVSATRATLPAGLGAQVFTLVVKVTAGTLGDMTLSNTATLSATNDANPANNTATAMTTVIYAFQGFFPPVANPPNINVVTAGSAVPVKFSLGGNQGLDIFAAGSPSSAPIPCDGGALSSEIPTVTAGSSSLSYDSVTGQYVYVWKTESAWAGTCRRLTVQLNDGTAHTALFRFR
jgi:uncharacterized repeat protein (TIGR01451 family)